ncbi:PA-domain containing subtilase family protein [Actinidia rufa]|uniref:PA-domain containing subtilase family protein n=1 Tax=Actinidia rufa TaxID=165716 RepID=A0A7J0FXK5_9ERIC|nr:PA-domain containing subtilase family protein [Actinidia rufa]
MIVIVSCIAEERDTYLVLMEGGPVAFHRGSMPEEGRKVDSNRAFGHRKAKAPELAYDPTNPFASNLSRFLGTCEDGPQFPMNSCNGKIVSARIFSAGAQAVATLNASVDFLSPFDAVGHGREIYMWGGAGVASTAAGNSGVTVVVNGFFYGQASEMAPRAQIPVYKAIYPNLGTLADVVAAMDQIISKYYEEKTCRDKREFVTSYGGRAAIGEGRVASYMGRAPIVSRFSSRGPDFINYDRNPIDVLKPDILAPSHQIWAAWIPMCFGSYCIWKQFCSIVWYKHGHPSYCRHSSADQSKKKPSWTPSTIASAMSTTATKYDNNGEPIMAEGSEIYTSYPSTSDFGAGLVYHPVPWIQAWSSHRLMVCGNEAGYEDYISFLFFLPNTDPATIKTATGGSCNNSFINPSDLSTPSVTISALWGYRLVLV